MENSLEIKSGFPTPLGCSNKEAGINFALFSEHASQVTLCLFSEGKNVEIPLDPNRNRTGWVWHILIQHLQREGLEYGFRIDGPTDAKNRFDPNKILLDPYAKALNTSNKWGQQVKYSPRARVIPDLPFDWEGTQPLKLAPEELIIYEMHVRGFTQHPSSKVKHPGSFLGISEKIPYLKELGVNAIELMPIFEFNECELKLTHPKTGQKLKNVWGYSPTNFFTPMNRYSSTPNGATQDFRTLVRELHKNQIEIYLDVVYNHTAEGGEDGPLFSFKGIDNGVYYLLDERGNYLNFSGTGNTLSANHPIVVQLIVDSLRYWVSEMHVDGFRFDLASCLTRNEHGISLPNPPVIEAIISDPVLADVKMIAEAWDAGGLYQVGCFPGGNRWFEWNGQYRDVTRRFIKGTDGQAGVFAKVLSASEELYGINGLPYNSINFITAHDGFTLRDLVSYQKKHNEDNGENNRDGMNENDSWNCGYEGPTSQPEILLLREKQMRNLHTALMVAIGTPMIFMGDEYGHTKWGNNNSYCQDSDINAFLWDALKTNQDFARFHKLMIHFRKANPLLHRTRFLNEEDVSWHGVTPNQPNWNSTSRFVSYTLHDTKQGNSLYITFNANFTPVSIIPPSPPPGKHWYPIVNTSLPSPDDFHEDPTSHPPLQDFYTLDSYCVFIAKALA